MYSIYNFTLTIFVIILVDRLNWKRVKLVSKVVELPNIEEAIKAGSAYLNEFKDLNKDEISMRLEFTVAFKEIYPY